MGPREKKLREHLAKIPGVSTDMVLAASHGWRSDLREARLADALQEALTGWEYAAQYKGDYLAEKHGDAEDIAQLRAVLAEVDRG